MDKENLEKCRRVSVVLTPLKSSEIKKWKNQRKSNKKRKNRWQKGYVKPKKPPVRKLSVSSSNIPENSRDDAAMRTPVTHLPDDPPPADTKADEAKELSVPGGNDEALALWKYKRKRASISSNSGDEEPAPKRVTDPEVTPKKLTINLPRLNVQMPSRGVLLDDESEAEAESVEDAASLIMDSCEDSVHAQSAQCCDDRAQEVQPLREKPRESDASDEEVVEESERLVESASQNSEPESVNMTEALSDDENESDNDEELMDLCLMKEPTVLVTKLEDVIESLEHNRYFPDRKHLTNRHLDIIKRFTSQDDSEDSYCLIMSPDSESAHSSSSSNDEEDEYKEDDEDDEDDDDDDDELFTTNRFSGRLRNRRRISSDMSSSSEVDSLRNAEDDASSGAQNLTVIEESGTPADGLGEKGPTGSEASSCSNIPAANEEADVSDSPETILSAPLSCGECKESFATVGGVLNHTCEPTSPNKGKSKGKAMKTKKHPKLTPKSTSLECTLCSQTLENPELLQRHLWTHSAREHEEAFKAAKRQSRSKQSQPGIELLSSIDSDKSDTEDKSDAERTAHNEPGIAIMNEKSPTGSSKKTSVSVAICPCHVDDLKPTDLTVQIEMVLFCEICKVLFRRSECIETHYRTNALCNKDRRKGRSPKLFCSTCRVVLSNLSDMRKHLEKHVSINRHGTVTFVCNICRVVFFGVGTVFCTHWFNHEKDPMFVASRYSFPKLCVSNRGKNPIGKQPGEQYFFVAEYVCRSCKQQFSSDGDLLNHMRECKGEETKQPSFPKEVPKEPPKDTPAPPAPPAPPPVPEPAKKPAEKVHFNVIPKSQVVVALSPRAPRPRGRPVLLKPPPSRPVPRSAVNIPTPPRNILPQPTPAPPPATQTEKVPQTISKSPPKPKPRAPPAVKVIQTQKIPLLIPKPAGFQDMAEAYVKTWICDICQSAFSTRKSLVEEHASTHFDATLALLKFNKSVDRPFACTICRKAYGSLDALNNHWLKHELMRYWCSVCKDTYYNLSAYIRHVAILCRNENPTCRVSFGTKEICRLCNLAFNNSNDLSRHNIDYHAAGRIVGTRVELRQLAPQTVVTRAQGSDSQSQRPTTPPNNLIPVSCQFSPTSPKTSLPSAVILSPSRNSQSGGLVLCVQPQNNNEIVTSQQVNGPVVINIAIPNVVNNSEQTTSPPKVRALEDPTVQVVLTQANTSESTLSASLVTNLQPVKTMEATRNQNSSTFALTVRDTTATGGSVTERDSAVEEETISSDTMNSLLQNRPVGVDANAQNNENPRRDVASGTGSDVGRLAVEDIPENNTTNNSDDVQILEVTKSAPKTAPKTSPQKQVSLLKKSLLIPTAPDSDIEILSETSAQDEPEKAPPAEQPPEQAKKKSPEEAEGSSANLVKNPLSKPHGFLRVKNLSELQDENKSCNDTRGNRKKGNTLTEHLMARLRPTKQPAPSANGLESEVNTGNTERLVSSPHVPGSRILPNIPQRIQGTDARRATPLSARQDSSSGPQKPMNRVTPIPTSNTGNGHYSRTINPQLYGGLSGDERLQGTVNQGGNTQNTYMQGQRQLVAHNKYKCLVCSTFETDSPGAFQKHFATHSQQMLSSAIQNCNMAYSQQLGNAVSSMYGQYQYQNQVPSSTTHNPQVFSCSLCSNYQFTNYQDLQAHIQTIHGNIMNVSERFVCALCPNVTVFDNEQMLKEHQDTQHTFLCTICMQKFNNSFELDSHCSLHKDGQIGSQYENSSG